MEAISGYGSDSSDASQGAGASKKQRVALVKRPQVTAAPNLGAVGSAGVTPDYVPGTLTLVKANPTAAASLRHFMSPHRDVHEVERLRVPPRWRWTVVRSARRVLTGSAHCEACPSQKKSVTEVGSRLPVFLGLPQPEHRDSATP